MKSVTPYPGIVDLKLAREFAEAINQAAAGRLRNVVKVTGDYVAGDADHVIEVTPTAPCLITLPSPDRTAGVTFTVKRMNTTVHLITIAPASGQIDGAANKTNAVSRGVVHAFSDGSTYSLH